MKKNLPYLLLLFCSGLLLSFSYACYYLNEVLKQLEITEERAKEYVVDNMENDPGFSIPSTAAARAIPDARKVDVVNKLGDFVKAYVSSDAFKKAYEEKRNTWDLKSWEQLLDERVKQSIKDADEALAEAPAAMAKASAAMKPMYERQLKELKESREALMDPKHPKHAKYRKEVEEELMQDEDKTTYIENYKSLYADREKRLPADINVLLKMRLQEFLRETANMPWDAKLEKKRGVMVFVDPTLENKKYSWKKLFRCGKVTIEAARNYAQAWLKTLPAK